MSRILAAIFTGSALSAGSMAHAAGLCVADVQGALITTAKGQAAQARIDTRVRESQVALRQLQAKLEAYAAELEATTDPSSRAQLEGQLVEEQASFEASSRRLHDAIQLLYDQLLEGLTSEILEVVQALGVDQGCSVVIDTPPVLYVGVGARDLTEQLVARYDEAHPLVPGAGP
ncbi:MAG TPA: OmpH family outer membrane protein [Deltaproteobacteria bacterium]|nr:OmpH family outer membrane protein [Deltaproteobacteria bacterium]